MLFAGRQIIDSLRHWVEEFHVDGFLFVNGSALVTGPHGQELSRPPLVEAISFDPILAGTKLIVNTSSPFTGVSKVSHGVQLYCTVNAEKLCICQDCVFFFLVSFHFRISIHGVGNLSTPLTHHNFLSMSHGLIGVHRV